MLNHRSCTLGLFKTFSYVETSNKKILHFCQGSTQFHMVARFNNMLGILNHSLKIGLKSCEIPVNKLCLNTLRLLRQKNLIYGFTYVSSKKKSKRLFPRVKIFLKMADYRTSTIRYVRPAKQTLSNFTLATAKINYQQNANKKLLLTNPAGLNLVTLDSLNKNTKLNTGKILAELSY